MLKAHAREDGPEMETTAGVVGEPNANAALQAAMAVTACGPGGDNVTLARLPQRPMIFQDDEVGM